MNDSERGCILPIAQAAAMGILSGLLTLAVAMWQTWTPAGWLALAVGSGAALLTFCSGVLAWRRAEFREPEPIYHTSTVTEQAQTVRVELSQDDGRKLNLIELPASSEQLQALARGLLDGASLSESTWSGGNGLFSRSEFSQLRAELIRRGLARWNNPNTPARGATLTPAGRGIMREFAMLADGKATTPISRVLKSKGMQQ